MSKASQAHKQISQLFQNYKAVVSLFLQSALRVSIAVSSKSREERGWANLTRGHQSEALGKLRRGQASIPLFCQVSWFCDLAYRLDIFKRQILKGVQKANQ